MPILVTDLTVNYGFSRVIPPMQVSVWHEIRRLKQELEEARREIERLKENAKA